MGRGGGGSCFWRRWERDERIAKKVGLMKEAVGVVVVVMVVVVVVAGMPRTLFRARSLC